MDNLGLLSSLHFPNVLFPCSPLMYSALMMASLYGCRCLMCKKNGGLKRSLTNCETASSEFSLSKCRRLNHHAPDSPLARSNDTSASHKCCAGTQTLFSSFVPVHSFYPQPPSDSSHHDLATNEEEPRFILDLDHHMARSSSQGHPAGIVLGAGTRLPPHPPSSPSSSSLETESNNAPLNLTLSPSSKSGLLSSRLIGHHDDDGRHDDCAQWTKDQSGVSVIGGIHGDGPGASRVPGGGGGWRGAVEGHGRSTNSIRAPDSLDNKAKRQTQPQQQQKLWPLSQDVVRPNAKSKSQSTQSPPRKASSSSSSSVVTVECADDIEEHFQRSLGKDYSKRLTTSSSTSSSSSGAEFVPSEHPSTNALNARHNGTTEAAPANDHLLPPQEKRRGSASISGAVDDHFAKSLGQTWTELRSQSSQADFRLPQPGSVDDHFAKALGQETWFKLRVKKEGT